MATTGGISDEFRAWCISLADPPAIASVPTLEDADAMRRSHHVRQAVMIAGIRRRIALCLADKTTMALLVAGDWKVVYEAICRYLEVQHELPLRILSRHSYWLIEFPTASGGRLLFRAMWSPPGPMLS
jgi:hypothetical protein